MPPVIELRFYYSKYDPKKVDLEYRETKIFFEKYEKLFADSIGKQFTMEIKKLTFKSKGYRKIIEQKQREIEDLNKKKPRTKFF